MGNKLYYYKECEEVFFISHVIPKSINLNNIKNNVNNINNANKTNNINKVNNTNNINNKYTRE